MLIDLHRECETLKSQNVKDRGGELAERLPEIAVCAVGGFPFLYKDNELTWIGRPVDYNGLQNFVIEALGLSGVLTYTNKSGKTLKELGNLCLNLKHLWGFHWINCTLVFARFPLEVQLAFARDRRFYLSWIADDTEGKVFTATAGLKEWQEYLTHREDASFDLHTRRAMQGAYSILNTIYEKQ